MCLTMPLIRHRRAPCGARLSCSASLPASTEFQSTRPLRGATPGFVFCQPRECNFNPRAPCGARPGRFPLLTIQPDFNPRAPCGARRPEDSRDPPYWNFNPRAPCGARRFHFATFDSSSLFQSTRPLRGATRTCFSAFRLYGHFKPRAPCGARRPP